MASESTSEEVGVAMPSSPPRENLIRAVREITLERGDGATMPTLTGHFAVWDQWTEIRSAFEGNFLERFSPSSMTKTLGENTPKVLFQHGHDPQVGDKPLGTPTRVEPDSTGAFYEVAMLDTSYNRDLLPGLEAGLYGASFRFSILRENVDQKPKRSDYNPRGIPERTVQEARVMEFGPVTFPAYSGATAGIRSMTDEFLIDELIRKPDLARRAGISLAGLNTPAGCRYDNDDTGCLAQMIVLASGYIDEQDEPGDADAAASMQGVVKTLAGLLQYELTEPEAAEDEENSTGSEGTERGAESDPLEPEPSAATTQETPGTEPEPSEATTHSDRGLFWFADPPKTHRS